MSESVDRRLSRDHQLLAGTVDARRVERRYIVDGGEIVRRDRECDSSGSYRPASATCLAGLSRKSCNPRMVLTIPPSAAGTEGSVTLAK